MKRPIITINLFKEQASFKAQGQDSQRPEEKCEETKKQTKTSLLFITLGPQVGGKH